jgi:hypothetical protein
VPWKDMPWEDYRDAEWLGGELGRAKGNVEVHFKVHTMRIPKQPSQKKGQLRSVRNGTLCQWNRWHRGRVQDSAVVKTAQQQRVLACN